MIRLALRLMSWMLLTASVAAWSSSSVSCLKAAAEILSQPQNTSKSWPFAAAELAGFSPAMRKLNPSTEFSAFVMKITNGKRPKNILLDATHARPDERLSAVDLHLNLENWAQANQEKFITLSKTFDVDVKDLVSAYFKQDSAHLDNLMNALLEHQGIIPKIVEDLKTIPVGNHGTEYSIKQFVEAFLSNPVFLKAEYSLPQMNENIYEIQRALNNMNFSLSEFTKRLNRQKISYAEFKKMFWVERNNHTKPGKFSTIMTKLETRFKELRRVTKLETLRDAPWEFKEFSRRILSDGRDQTLEWLANLQPAQVARIFQSIRKDLSQKFVTNPDLLRTAVSLTIFDTFVFAGTQLLRNGELGTGFALTLGSIIASEIPLTFASVSKMAAVAAKEFPGSRTLSQSALHNAPLSATNFLPKSWEFTKSWVKDASKDSGMLFAYSGVMTLATQLTAQAAGWREGEDVSVMGATFEIALWFAVIANLRYKLAIGRIQTPLSATKFMIQNPKANFLMVQGVTATNIATGNLLWVYLYSPYFRQYWNEYLDPERQQNSSHSSGKPTAMAEMENDPDILNLASVRAAREFDEFEEKIRLAMPDDTDEQLEALPNN